MSVDQTLVPVVKMGVEAREQILTKTGLEDAAVTAATHPLKNLKVSFFVAKGSIGRACFGLEIGCGLSVWFLPA